MFVFFLASGALLVASRQSEYDIWGMIFYGRYYRYSILDTIDISTVVLY